MDQLIVSLAERRIGLTACIKRRGSVNEQRHGDIVSNGEIHGGSSLITGRAFLCVYEL